MKKKTDRDKTESNIKQPQDVPDQAQAKMDNPLLNYNLARRVTLFLGNKDLKQFAQSSTGADEAAFFELQARQFLQHVAYGEQDKAEEILKLHQQNAKNSQWILRVQTTVTDYSFRTFGNISAYEYAYWAKDTHMCRMLEKYMDDETKSEMLVRIDAIEQKGLRYMQHGVEIRNSKHFDLMKLKAALQQYSDGYDGSSTNNSEAEKAAWLAVGLAQRDVPVYVINEYCRQDRSFFPKPKFNEVDLPREITFLNGITFRLESVFPLEVSDSSGLGVNFALLREKSEEDCVGYSVSEDSCCLRATIDLEAISGLDEMRTGDLIQSRENLKPKEPLLCNGMSSS